MQAAILGPSSTMPVAKAMATIINEQRATHKRALAPLFNVRFGSKADIQPCLSDVRFTPKSRHSETRLGCPLCAKSDIQAISGYD